MGVTEKVWGPLAPPLIGVGGRGWVHFVDLAEGYAHKKFRENLTTGSLEYSTVIHANVGRHDMKTRKTESRNKLLHTQRDRSRCVKAGNVISRLRNLLPVGRLALPV